MKKEILELHAKMKSLTLWSGVKIQQYNSVVIELNEFTENDLQGCLAWLKKIDTIEYDALYKLWRLLPQETWEHYEKVGFTCNALILLKRARKKLRLIWNKPFRSQEQHR